jgi:hypothetical protein
MYREHREKDGNTMHKVLGLAVLAVAVVVGLGSVGCSKKDTTKNTTGGATATKTQETSADSKSTKVQETKETKATTPDKAPKADSKDVKKDDKDK